LFESETASVLFLHGTVHLTNGGVEAVKILVLLSFRFVCCSFEGFGLGFEHDQRLLGASGGRRGARRPGDRGG
jgi:hypothetical protein